MEIYIIKGEIENDQMRRFSRIKKDDGEEMRMERKRENRL